MSNYTKKQVADLVDGRLDWDVVHRMLSSPKDADRFVKFIAVLQERAAWPDRVLHDFEPDIPTFYKDWLGLDVPERAGA